MTQVTAFLQEHGLSQYVAAFEGAGFEELVDVEALIEDSASFVELVPLLADQTKLKRLLSATPKSTELPFAAYTRSIGEAVRRIYTAMSPSQQVFKCYNSKGVPIEVTLTSDTGVFDAADLREGIIMELQAQGNKDDLSNITIYEWDASDPTNKHKTGDPIVDCDNLDGSMFAYELPLAADMRSIAEALRLIDIDNMHHLELTLTDTKFLGRDQVMKEFETHLKAIQGNFGNDGKGQPIIATGATTGVGKSRLLDELRRIYKERGYAVVVVSYSSGACLLPFSEESNCRDMAEVESAFFSRLLCMMLPTEEFVRSRASSIHKRFKVDYAQLLEIMKKKFAGRSMLILMDEVGTLGQVQMPDGSRSDRAMRNVISLLGKLAHELTLQLGDGNCCAAMFTALSEGVVAGARTNAGRMIHSIPLPLLSEGDVGQIVRDRHPKADDTVVHHIFAMSAGHCRTVEKFINLDWDDTTPKALTTLEGLLSTITNTITNSAVGWLDEKEIRAILLEDDSTGVDFQELSRRSIVHVSKTKVVIVPVFLYKWAVETGPSPLAYHLLKCLEAAWNRICLSGEKECNDGRALERFLWHYEAVRRELVRGEKMSVAEFYRFPAHWKSGAEYEFRPIAGYTEIPNPPENMYANFSPTTRCGSAVTRYEPQKPNFPKYDWFTVMVDKDGNNVVKGEQSKHGSVQEADGNVVSVKLSTHPGDISNWTKAGWLVLGSTDLEQYLGSTLSFASVCVRHFSSKRKRDDQVNETTE